ncbi:hypothetical protein PO883_30450 [Massilia sp. DJPM01]|nr:hypothetical protein [Massilia sp. DJPM01]MDM5181503.1 hypothetical protein [Massilia sp. DJPM01]
MDIFNYQETPIGSARAVFHTNPFCGVWVWKPDLLDIAETNIRQNFLE